MANYRKKIYDKYISGFKRHQEPDSLSSVYDYRNPYRNYLRNWLPASKNASILEVACGCGKLISLLEKLGYTNIHGVDISSEQVALAQKNTSCIEQADVMEYLERTERSYDLIIAIDFIEHLKKEEVVLFLDLCSKRLLQKGRVIFQTPNADSPFCMSVFCGDFTHETCFSPKGLSRLLNLQGFTEIQMRETGPIIHGLVSFIRFILWKILRLLLLSWNLVETGGRASNVFTRVFLISAIKK